MWNLPIFDDWVFFVWDNFYDFKNVKTIAHKWMMAYFSDSWLWMKPVLQTKQDT